MKALTRTLTIILKGDSRSGLYRSSAHRNCGAPSLGTRRFTQSTSRFQEEPGGKKPLDEARAKILATEEELEARVAQLLEKVGARAGGGGSSSMMDAALTAAFGLGLGMLI